MPIEPRLRTSWTAALLCCAACVTGCDKSTSQATAPPPSTRAVAVTVEDATGARLPGVTVWAIQVSGTEAQVGDTDASGVRQFTLADGHWCLSTSIVPGSGPVLVAGSTGRVQAPLPGHPDSVLFRLVVRPESIVRGKVTLSGQSAHGGTIVGATELATFTSTAADGAFELGRLPPGTWTGLATHLGFQGKLFDVPVPFPGDTVTVGMVVLVPGGPMPRP